MKAFLHSVYSALICSVIWIIFYPSIIYSTERRAKWQPFAMNWMRWDRNNVLTFIWQAVQLTVKSEFWRLSQYCLQGRDVCKSFTELLIRVKPRKINPCYFFEGDQPQFWKKVCRITLSQFLRRCTDFHERCRYTGNYVFGFKGIWSNTIKHTSKFLRARYNQIKFHKNFKQKSVI